MTRIIIINFIFPVPTQLWADDPSPTTLDYSTNESPTKRSASPWASRHETTASSSLFENNSTHSTPMIDTYPATEFDFSAGGRLSDISRPKSAAPQMIRDYSSSLHNPLDALNGSGATSGSSTSSSFYNDLSALSIGSRRPASTGLIGAHISSSDTSSSVMGSLGLATSPANSVNGRKPRFMDLIQEDFPKSSLSPDDVNPQRQTTYPYVSEKSAQPSYHPTTQHGTKQFVESHNANGSTHSKPNSSSLNAHSHHHNNLSHPSQTNSYVPQYVNAPPYEPRRTALESHTQMYPTTHHVIPPETVDTTNLTNLQPQTIYTTRSDVNVPHQHHPMIHVQSYDPAAAASQYYNDGSAVGGGGGSRRDPNTPGSLNQPNGHRNTPQTIYMNQPTFGGYTTIQYHHPGSQTHTHPAAYNIAPTIPIVHDPNMQPRVLHPREYVPHGAIPADHAAPLYYWPNGAPAGSPSTVTILDASGRPTTLMAPLPLTTATAAVTAATNPSYSPMGRGKANGTQKKDRSRRSNRGGRTPKGGKTTLDGLRHSVSSASESLLEEYKSSKGTWKTFDIEGHIVEFCQDQNGSRFIQQRLEVAEVNEKLLVLKEVMPSVRRLRNDVFGNYVVQKLLAHGTKEMRDQLKVTFKNEMLSLSTQMYGCRVVQKAIETLEDEDMFELLSEYEGHVLSCIHDQNGNHVIQKCVEVMSQKANCALSHGRDDDYHAFNRGIQFIVDCVTDDIIPLSCHPYGCRVLQRMLEHCIPEIKSFTMDQLLGCHRMLLDDQYGNYVIQHVLQYGRDIDRQSILNIVIESGLLNMCRQKFASNVVEKLLKYGTNNHRTEIVREMLKTVEDNGQHGMSGSSVALLLVRDAYANYVVQTTLDVVPEGREKRLLIEELNNHADQLVCFLLKLLHFVPA